VLLCFTSCDKPVARMPIIRNNNANYKLTINWNRALVKLQDEAFKTLIAKNYNKQYYNSNLGFWYTYIKQNNNKRYTPKPSDNLIYTYQVTDLRGNIIYTYNDNGEKTYKVDKEKLISGLQNGLKLMHENDEVQFLFPSFLAYGVLGDRKKIKTNQPLIYTVYLKKIIINKNNNK